jgi:hypothetical protein
MKEERSTGIAVPVPNLVDRWRKVVSATAQPLNPLEKVPIPIVQEVGWAAGTVWTLTANLAPYRCSNPGPSSIQ